jgi:hypothetical protein
LVGGELEEVDLVFAEAFGDLLAEFGEDFEVAVADGGGVEGDVVFGVFEVFEAGEAGEGELQLVAVPELEDDDFLALVAEDANGFEEGGGVVEEVGDEDDEAAAFEVVAEGFDDRSERGFTTGFGLDHGLQHEVEMGDLGAVGDDLAEFGVEGDQADGVLLGHEEVGKGGGEFAGVVKFEDAAGSAVAHGAGGVENDGGAEVGFLVVFADVEAVGAAEDFPVEAADFIALDIGAVLAEFDREAFVGRGVEAGGEAFDDGSGEELQVLQAGDVFALKDVGKGGHSGEMKRGRELDVGRVRELSGGWCRMQEL